MFLLVVNLTLESFTLLGNNLFYEDMIYLLVTFINDSFRAFHQYDMGDAINLFICLVHVLQHTLQYFPYMTPFSITFAENWPEPWENSSSNFRLLEDLPKYS